MKTKDNDLKIKEKTCKDQEKLKLYQVSSTSNEGNCINSLIADFVQTNGSGGKSGNSSIKFD